MKVKLLTAMEMRIGMTLSCLPAGRVTPRILMRGERDINSRKQFLFRSSCEVPCSVVFEFFHHCWLFGDARKEVGYREGLLSACFVIRARMCMCFV